MVLVTIVMPNSVVAQVYYILRRKGYDTSSFQISVDDEVQRRAYLIGIYESIYNTELKFIIPIDLIIDGGPDIIFNAISHQLNNFDEAYADNAKKFASQARTMRVQPLDIQFIQSPKDPNVENHLRPRGIRKIRIKSKRNKNELC